MSNAAAPVLIAANHTVQELVSRTRVIALPYLSAIGRSYAGVFLHFEGIVGAGLPPVYDVYAGLPPAAAPDEEHRAGALPFYGLAAASKPRAGGMHLVLDMTCLFNLLRRREGWNETALLLHLVPRGPMSERTLVSIERINLYVIASGNDRRKSALSKVFSHKKRI